MQIQDRLSFDLRLSGSGRHKWFNSPVVSYCGPPPELRGCIPEFERRTFALAQGERQCSAVNSRLDLVIRKPHGTDEYAVPIGVVSKWYQLVPHREVLDAALAALIKADINPFRTQGNLILTEYGERMALQIVLPEQYWFDPGDRHPLALRLECFNSVEGSTRFQVLVGWFRFVCSNGLFIGVTKTNFQRRHIGDLTVEDIGAVLERGIKGAAEDRENFRIWRQTPLTQEVFTPWVDEELRRAWGFKAAARAYHIALTGKDATIVGPYKANSPTSIPLKPSHPVPGSPPKAQNIYDVSQILAWLARDRRDVQEQQEWREQIPELMGKLVA